MAGICQTSLFIGIAGCFSPVAYFAQGRCLLNVSLVPARLGLLGSGLMAEKFFTCTDSSLGNFILGRLVNKRNSKG